MDTANSDTIPAPGSCCAIFEHSFSGPLPAKTVGRSVESWLESSSDSESFQRFEAARKRSLKAERHCRLSDGSLRYADKPFTRERPRAVSPELRMFYIIEAAMEEIT